MKDEFFSWVRSCLVGIGAAFVCIAAIPVAAILVPVSLLGGMLGFLDTRVKKDK